MDNTKAKKWILSRIKILRRTVEAMQGNDIFADDRHMRILIADIRENCAEWSRFMQEIEEFDPDITED